MRSSPLSSRFRWRLATVLSLAFAWPTTQASAQMQDLPAGEIAVVAASEPAQETATEAGASPVAFDPVWRVNVALRFADGPVIRRAFDIAPGVTFRLTDGERTLVVGVEPGASLQEARFYRKFEGTTGEETFRWTPVRLGETFMVASPRQGMFPRVGISAVVDPAWPAAPAREGWREDPPLTYDREARLAYSPIRVRDFSEDEMHGTVVVFLHVWRDGVVTLSSIDAAATTASPELTQRVVDSLRRWRAEPAMIDGAAVQSLLRVPVEFRPTGD